MAGNCSWAVVATAAAGSSRRAGSSATSGLKTPCTSRWLRYRLPRQYVRRRGGPLCIGQKQRWYLLRMLSDDSRLNFAATDEPEFDQGRWVDYWAPVREVIYFKRAVYVRALQELGEQAFADGPPPRPDWLTDEMLRAPEPRTPRRRRPTRGAAATRDTGPDASGTCDQ
jgi:hypothetical protein